MARGGAQTTLAGDLGRLTVQTEAASAQTMQLFVSVPAVDGGAPLVLESSFARPVHAMAQRSAVTSAEVISILGIALLLISILAQRLGRARRNRVFQAAVEAAAAAGGRVTAPARDLAGLAGGVNGLLDVMTERQLEAQHASEAAAAERAAAASRHGDPRSSRPAGRRWAGRTGRGDGHGEPQHKRSARAKAHRAR